MVLDVLLIQPPVALPCEPPVGLGILAAGLRARGVSVRALDLSLRSVLARIAAPGAGEASSTRQRRALLARPRALSLLRSPAGYQNLDRYRSAVSTLTEALRLASPAGTRVGLANYVEAQRSPLRSSDLLAAAAEPQSSTFAGIFAEAADEAAGLRPRLIGLSVSFLHQVLPALALAGALRRRLPDSRILLGGALLACWRGRLDPTGLQPAIDRVVFGDGLPALLEELGRSAGSADPLLLPPDHSEAPFPGYLSPEPVAPLALSRGCCWGRCRYCPEALAGDGFRALPAGAIPAQLDQVRRLSGARFLHFTDSALPLPALQALAALRSEARWYGFARFDPELASPELCRALRRSGCRMLQLGLESASPRILRRLRKGINLTVAARILRELADAGIAVYLYLMFGVPGEEREDALQTLAFVAEHASHISFLNTALLNLPLPSPPEAELELLPLQSASDLGLYSGFRSSGGWDRRAARLFLEREFSRHHAVAALLRRTPPIFGPNHAAFFAEMAPGSPPSGTMPSHPEPGECAG